MSVKSRFFDSVRIAIDLETSGLSRSAGAVILAIGACAYQKNYGPGTGNLYTFYSEIRPTELQWLSADEKALAVNGLTWERLSKARPFEDVAKSFKEWIEDTIYNAPTDIWSPGIEGKNVLYLGQNPSFDTKFLTHQFTGDLELPIKWDEVKDLRDTYKFLVGKNLLPSLKYYSLSNMAEALNMGREPEPHNALTGAEFVMNVFHACVDIMEENSFP